MFNIYENEKRVIVEIPIYGNVVVDTDELNTLNLGPMFVEFKQAKPEEISLDKMGDWRSITLWTSIVIPSWVTMVQSRKELSFIKLRILEKNLVFSLLLDFNVPILGLFLKI